MKIRISLLFLFSVFFLKGFADNYEIIELTPHKDSISFDLAKNWYIVLIEEPDKEKDTVSYVFYFPLQEKVIPINIKNVSQYFRKDSLYYSDSLYYFRLQGELLNKRGKFLIGTTDTLDRSTDPYNEYETYRNYLGFSEELTFQFLRTYSPFITFNITGEVIMKNHRPETIKHQFLIDCDFDSYTDHKIISYGKNEIKKRISFTQSLNKLINEYYKVNNIRERLKITYCYLYHIGYIDDDAIKDVIIHINGKRYLFLSANYDFDKRIIFHLEKVWEPEDHFEF